MDLKKRVNELADDFIKNLIDLEVTAQEEIKKWEKEKLAYIRLQCEAEQKKKDLAYLYERKTEETSKARSEYEKGIRDVDTELGTIRNKQNELEKVIQDQKNYLDGIKADKKLTEEEFKKAQDLKNGYTAKLSALRVDFDKQENKAKELVDRENKCRSREIELLRKEDLQNERDKALDEKELDIQLDRKKVDIELKKLQLK